MRNDMQQHDTEQKYEEREYRFDLTSSEIETQSHSTLVEIIELNESSYIDCEMNGHGIDNCKVMKRILHLLVHYQQNENVNMYEYISSLKNYDVPTFMEDWYQVKKNHLRNTFDVNWIHNFSNVSCTSRFVKDCKYVRRYQRERENDIYDNISTDIDFNDIILKDQLDSIHSFIFHSMQSRNIQRNFSNVEC
eukprot:350434_1